MAISDESRDAYWNKGAYSKEARIIWEERLLEKGSLLERGP